MIAVALYVERIKYVCEVLKKIIINLCMRDKSIRNWYFSSCICMRESQSVSIVKTFDIVNEEIACPGFVIISVNFLSVDFSMPRIGFLDCNLQSSKSSVNLMEVDCLFNRMMLKWNLRWCKKKEATTVKKKKYSNLIFL